MLLGDLRHVDWPVLAATYGSFHQTAIGLLVSWWNNRAHGNFTLDEPPDCRPAPGARRADLILCENGKPRVVVEVEGTRYGEKLATIGSYFDAGDACYATMTTGILLAYPTSAQGKRPYRRVKAVETDPLVDGCRAIVRQRPGHTIILAVVSKRYEHIHEGVRSKSEYYYASVTGVLGIEVSRGDRVRQATLWGEPQAPGATA